MYKRVIKPTLDFVICFLALICVSPVLFLLIIILSIEYKGKPFFRQSRPGKNEKEIKIIKFKSMNDKKDEEGNLLPNNERITKFGNFLRKTSLDELPQLINVLKGDMSIVGPRPLLFKYLPLYSEEQRKRHTVKPGITGLAQINGRNTISWIQKFEYDIEYVENISFILDLQIIFKTANKVLLSKDINAGEQITMPPFNGSN